jgi:hypothetical protein
MKRLSGLVICALFVHFPVSKSAQRFVRVHYLGHASFVLEFDNGVTVLTDYGRSRAYGLDSPIFGLGDLKPDIVTYSHRHEDHEGSPLPEGIPHILRDGQRLPWKGLRIRSIPTYERTLESPDNFAYEFLYDGFRILHAGDCQGLITNCERSEIQSLIATTYPGHYDLVSPPGR